MVSIVTNGWFKLYAPGSIAAFYALAEPVCIDLKDAFAKQSLRLTAAAKLDRLHSLHSCYEAYSRHSSLFKESMKYREDRDTLLAEIAAAAPHVDMIAFSGPVSGQIALHLSFDEAVNIHALARSGKIIELIHDETGHNPQVHVRTPSIPSFRRGLSTPLGKPRAVKL